ncbi:MAG: beta-propeller domain-containing protein, partial [Nitrospirae bacterium]|nr:beta-propeller domain-containing protein [Nitrospirota bacterium]
MKTTVVGSWLLVAALALVAGCAAKNNDAASGGGEPGVPVPLASLQLKPSAGCDDLKRYLEASWIEGFTSALLSSSRGGGGAPPVAGDGPAGGVAASASPDDVSQTNTQEPGVDEADRIKADRNGNLYAISNGFLVVEQGFPPEALHELSRLDLGASGQALYLDEANHRAVVIASAATPGPVPLVLAAAAPISDVPYVPDVQLIFIDVSDPTAPSITQRLSLEGFAVGSRRVGNRIHLVSRFWISLPKALQDNQPLRDLIDRYQAAVRD